MDQMDLLAASMADMFSERGHNVQVALDADRAFRRSRRSQSSLIRDLVLEAVERGSTTLGIGVRQIQGGGLDIVRLIDGVERRYRLRKATCDPDTGEFVVLSPTDSIMTIEDVEPNALFPVQRWLLGYVVTGEGGLGQVFEARVRGLTSDTIPELVLESVRLLGGDSGGPGSAGSFVPDESDYLEDLDLDEDNEEGEETA